MIFLHSARSILKFARYAVSSQTILLIKAAPNCPPCWEYQSPYWTYAEREVLDIPTFELQKVREFMEKQMNCPQDVEQTKDDVDEKEQTSESSSVEQTVENFVVGQTSENLVVG